ncbi:MAG: hypothetical protein KKF89_05535 [Nanoarchaeota archaeon]|nr:hypothetical protein [Nanoarchaeota archaeon]
MDNFLKRKQDILSKQDKSSKQSWDKKIVKLCEKINKSENYYTTSSCAGRIVLIIDDKRRENVFLQVYHDLIKFKELKNDLGRISFSHPPPLKLLAHSCSRINNTDKGKSVVNESLVEKFNEINFEAINSRVIRGQMIKFKQEPPILHVACRTLEDAQKLVDKARLSGWKRSGIIITGKRFVVELMSTEKLEFLIMNNNRLLVNNEFLELIVKKSNDNLKEGWGKIDRLT